MPHPLPITSVDHLPPIKVQIPAPQEQEDQITSTERNQNPKIPPPRIEANRQRLVELIAHAVSAVRTVRGRIVGDVTRSAAGEERAHVIPAGLAGRGGKQVEFGLRAGYGEAVELGGDEA